MMRTRCLFVCFFLLGGGFVFSQDSLTIIDAREIQYKSKQLVQNELNDLLNSISSQNSETKQIKDMIYNSHSGSRNKIFLSKKALVENDINPQVRSTNTSQEMEIEHYLNDFDLYYKKTPEASVVITDVNASHVKKSDSIYVKVYFSCLFRSQNKNYEEPYSQNHRMAEVRVRREDNRWVAYIARIGFYNPEDTANDFSNDVALKRERGPSSIDLLTDSASIAAAQRSFEEELRQKEEQKLVEEEKIERSKFNNLLAEGDKAANENNFTEALRLYKEAKELRPYDPAPQAKITNAVRKRETLLLTQQELFNQYIQEAQLAEKKREYQKAIDAYRNAIAQKPEQAAQYEQRLKKLTATYLQVDALQEKYKAGLFREAVKEYDAAIKKDNNISDYHLGRGKCYFKLGEFDKALKDYDQAITLDSDNLEAIQLRAELYKLKKDYFKALNNYKQYLTVTRENPRIYEEMSDLRMLLNSPIDEAIADLNEGLKLFPKVSSLYLKKGLLQLQKNDFKEAHGNFTSSLRLDSSNAFAFFNRGVCEVNLKKVYEAAKDFEIARQKGVDSVYIREIESFAKNFYDRAAEKFSGSNKDSAIMLADYAIAITPYKSGYWFTRGDYYLFRKDYQQAIVNYDQAIKLNSNYTDAYHQRGFAYYGLRNFPVAIENFDNALKSNFKLYTAQKGSGDSYLALKDYPNAVRYYENCITTTGSIKSFNDAEFLSQVYNSLGRSYYELKQYDKSLAALRNAIRKNAAFAEAYFYRGLTYHRTSELQSAIEDITKAISLNSSNSAWYYHLAKAQQDKKDYINAVGSYTNCIKADSAKALNDAVYYRGLCNYLMQNYTGALPDYVMTASYGLDSTIKTYRYELANIYLNTGKYDSSITLFRELLGKDPYDALVMYGLGSALFLTGKLDESIDWFDKSFQTKKISHADVKKDKLIAALRDDKKFKQLIKKYF